MLFIVIALFRIRVLLISKRNEQELLESGGKEYGEIVSELLAILHTLFYFCALFEGIYKKVQFDSIGLIGTLIIGLSFFILIRVIQILGKYWTVKLIFADKHTLNTNWLFKHVKHPNYFFNIIPELIGVTLVFHAWYTLLILLMSYGICLYLRIREENQLLANLK
ncbi:isoprenylcysteine carboxylmethyltransferase family protein [Enterococcus wangshanyuanii]|uniref:Isoprenylcysteine carboxyl methyltransferase n=1 Tax=Enterococcus wangshanyuanii TaxID=2005703 RepID=A0ABQ1PBV1_9ENTE|nr:isoprenylcysteine carboxylmethyltransferase family protein [Enterococcus wangshanyuanii]GGC94167.1 isoprenylcysteine carboxyl methyltransferase [Enterococcus wangshanyuanii]